MKFAFQFQSVPVFPVIQIEGMIAPDGNLRKNCVNYKSLDEPLKIAFTRYDSPSVGLLINSPGGSPSQTEALATYIRALSKIYKKKVIAFAEDLMTSGAYYLACTASEIYVCETSIVGSIGVIMKSFEFAEAMKKLGVKRRIISKGKNKALLDPFVPESSENRQIIEEVLTDVQRNFVEWVLTNRGKKIRLDKDEMATGRIWTGKQAVELGLADGIMTLHEYVITKISPEAKIVFLPKKSGIISLGFGFINEMIDAVTTKLSEKIDILFNSPNSFLR